MTSETSKTQSEAEELAALFPEPLDFPIGKGGMKILLTPMDLATCAKFTQRARPIFEAFRSSKAPVDNFDEFMEVALPEVLTVCAENPDVLMDAISIACHRTPEFVGKLPPGVVLALAGAIFKVNSDFFIQTAGNLASGVLEIMQEKASRASVGQTH